MDSLIQTHIQRKDYAAAEQLLREELQSNPQSADTYYWFGIVSYFKGRIGEAVENLTKCLNLDAHHTDAAICLSVLYNDIGKYDEAKKVFEQANQSVAHKKSGDDPGIDRKFAVKHFELGDLYFRYRRYDSAIEEYAKAVFLDPDALEARIRMAKAYAKKGYMSRAIQELQELKNENPLFIAARIQLGLLHYSQGNVLDAELEWETILDIDANHREAKAYLEMAKEARVQTR